jgi:outer membrane protein insertion porin family
VIRGQAPGREYHNAPTAGNGDYLRYPMLPSEVPVTRGQNGSNQVLQPFANPNPGGVPTATFNGPNDYTPILPDQPTNPGFQPFNPPAVDLNVFVEEARTGRFMFGAGVNSDLGVTGQIVIDERNFDPLRFPSSFEDVINGTAWRGAGQGFRLEAMPGSQVQRYLATHTMPYVYMPGIPEPFVLNTSGFYYTRNFFDWNEQRLGGRLALGYRITQDLSLTGSIRAEEVSIFDPRVVGLVPQLDRVIGDNELFSGRITLAHDTRDNAFLATQGHYFEVSYEQTFGSFDYPRGELDYRQYFLMRERPDTSGRHTLAYSFRLGFSGTQTPIYENYFSGGYSTMRGFDFRGASPIGPAGVAVGGQFRFLGSVEYFFPITADDMIKGVAFCDFGTTEAEIEMHGDNYRISPGFGLRLNIPAMGPAPLALDLAIPVARAPTDNIQNFSFFFGFSR